jgi:ATP-binding cassette subfamily F protein 3
MVRIEKLTYRIGGRVLFDRAEANIPAGHRIGLVGRNGTGKTTLLRLIIGELEPDEGRITIPAGWRVGMTRQEAPDGPADLIETVLAADAELARLSREAETAKAAEHIARVHARLGDLAAYAAPARAARILKGLGFDEAAQRRPCASFSGGLRMRVALAGLLFTAPDLLLLDEPTNHLDLESSLWLQDFLSGYPGTLIIVSHDREVLNRVAAEILSLEGAKLSRFSGGYDRFEEARRLKRAQNEKERRRQEAERAHIRAFVERFRFKASKARQAQSRLKRLEKMQPIAEVADEGAITFAFPDPSPLPPPLLYLDQVDIGYGATTVLKRVDLRLDSDDRVALLGANGNGKSTLIKLLAGRLSPLRGNVRRSHKLRIGYFAQHQADELDTAATPLIELARRRPREPEVQLRAHLGRFGFSQERAETPVAALSGGEKARLLFALMSINRPHLLLLDEPTNHLDIVARQALIEALNAFQGAVVLVSHDPHLIELTADRLWLVEGGQVQPFEGDLDDYRARVTAARAGRPADGVGVPRVAETDRRAERRQAAERRAAVAPLKRQLTQTEAEIDRLNAEKQRLLDELAAPELYRGDATRLLTLQQRLAEIDRHLTASETRWFDLHAALDAASDAANAASGLTGPSA